MKLKKIILTASLFLSLFSLPAFAEKRIAVLPFDVPDSRPEMKQFGFGITDTITIALSNIQEFIMIDRSQFQNVLKEQSIQQSGLIDSEKAVKLGKLLGAEILVIGAIQTDGNNYRITARLTEVETGRIIKAVQVTGTNIFELQDKIAQEVISQQQIKPTETVINRIKNVLKATNDVNAYDSYIQGRNSFLLFTAKGYQNAIDYYDKALSIDNSYTLALASKAEAQALLSSEMESSGKPYKEILDNALINAKEALKQSDNLGDVHRALSMIYKIQGKFAEGKNEAEKALKLNPNDADAYYLLWANSSASIEDPLIQKAVSLNPFIVKKHIAIGYAYHKQSKYREAVEIYKQAIQLNPKFITAYVALGYSYDKLNELENAEQAFRNAIAIKNSVADGHAGLGLILFKKGKLKESFYEFDKAIQINPYYSYAHTSLGYVYYALGKKDEAYKEFKIAIDLNPDDFYVRDALGYYYLEKGQIDEALDQFTTVLGINYTDVDGHYNIGLVYRIQGKIDEAIGEFKEAIKIYPDYLPARTKLAETYLQIGKNDLAIAEYKEAIRINPDIPENFINLGIAYYKMGKYDDSINQYKQAIGLRPSDVSTHNNLGIAYYSKGKYDMAIDEYNIALTISPSDLNATENLGLVYAKIGKKEQAIQLQKKACLLGSESACNWIENNI